VPGRIRGSCAVAVPSSTVSAWTPWQRTIGMQKVAFTTLPVRYLVPRTQYWYCGRGWYK
jgi:hypothetical protein